MAQNKTIGLPGKNGTEQDGQYEPACRLVSLFTASGVERDAYDIALKLGRKAASHGETVLMLDAVDGAMLQAAGIVYSRTLDDISAGTAEIQDALFVTSNEHFTAGAVGPAGLENALGLLASLSMSYDWVFVVPKAGCEPAHIRLGSASDVSVISYSSQGDKFMRAFWMIETAFMLSETVREHLGAPPPYAGHMDDLHLEARLLEQMRVQAARCAAA